MTARALAKELDVSERTIFRDISALSTAGVPVYGESGRDGGFSLLDSYRTRLTGLSEGEVRALFMLSSTAALSDLGVSHELQSAFLKLSASLPEARRQDQARVRQRFHLDSAPWNQGDEPVPHLGSIHQALWEDRRIHLRYRLPLSLEIEQLVAPYGLVAKAGVWYVVCAHNGTFRTHRVSALTGVQISDEHFERSDDFDLEAHWEEFCAERERSSSHYTATLRISTDFLSELPKHFGRSVHPVIAEAKAAESRWITLDLPFESLEAARDKILSFGRGVEVMEPIALRMSVHDYATQIVSLYTE